MLGELTVMLSGGTPSKSNPDYWNGTVPWASAKDMKNYFLADTEDHISDEAVQKATKLVPAGTVLLLTRGMTLLDDVPICLSMRPMTFNQDVKALRSKNGLLQEYLPYLLLGHKADLLDLVDLAGHGTGRLNSDELKNLPVLLPPESEQSKIAQFLGTVDNRLYNLSRQNESIEAIAQAIFKSWFVDFDPVRAKAEGREPEGMDATTAALFPGAFKDSELGPIPQGWTIHGIDTIATFLNGIALQKYPAMEGEEWLPAIKIAQLKCGSVDGADRISRSIPEKYIVQDGDLLFSWSGSLEVEFWTGGKGALNQHLFKVFSAQFPQWFVYLWLRFHLDGFREIAESKVTTMGHIQRHHLSEAIVVIPPPETLRGLDRFLGPLIEKVVAGRLQARTLAELRDTLLPRLISGKLRVPEVEAMLTGGCREV